MCETKTSDDQFRLDLRTEPKTSAVFILKMVIDLKYMVFKKHS